METRRIALFSFLLFLCGSALAEGPHFRHQDTIIDQEFQNAYRDIRALNTINRSTGTISSFTATSGTFTVILATQSITTSSETIYGQLNVLASGSIPNTVRISTGSGGITISSAIVVSNTSQPSFLVAQNGVRTDFTGDGYIAPLSWDTKIFDQTNSFSGSTFTVPVAGVYAFVCQVAFQNILATHVTMGWGINVNGDYLTGGPYRGFESVGGVARPLFARPVVAFPVLLNAGDKIGCNAFGTASTKTIDAGGGTSVEFFGGVKIW